MTFMCPRCLRIVALDPSGPDRDIVSAYCLHAGPWAGGGLQAIRMEPVPEPVPALPEPAGMP